LPSGRRGFFYEATGIASFTSTYASDPGPPANNVRESEPERLRGKACNYALSVPGNFAEIAENLIFSCLPKCTSVFSDVRWRFDALKAAKVGQALFTARHRKAIKKRPVHPKARAVDFVLTTIVAIILSSVTVIAQPSKEEGIPVLRFDGITFQPGLRIQFRYSYDQSTGTNDFFLRRIRLKGRGDAFDIAKYYVEVRIDNVGQERVTSSVRLETAYIEFPVQPSVTIRFGQYDDPFSKDLLTSDSKLLLMDRALIIGAEFSLPYTKHSPATLRPGTLGSLCWRGTIRVE